jgi:general secretion pathway protein H
MPISAAGNRRLRGFTLLELLVVVAITAVATAGVSLALRDSGATTLEREAQRLAALLESARAQSRASGVAVRWEAHPGGFRFDGLSAPAPGQWLSPDTHLQTPVTLVLGPEPLIGAQTLVLTSRASPQLALRVSTDGLRPFIAGLAAPHPTQSR